MAGNIASGLDLLDREIREENAAVSRQRALIMWLAGDGQSTAMAEALLGIMEGELAALVAQRELPHVNMPGSDIATETKPSGLNRPGICPVAMGSGPSARDEGHHHVWR